MKPFQGLAFRVMPVPTRFPESLVKNVVGKFRQAQADFKDAQAAYDEGDPASVYAFWTASKEFSEAGLAICRLAYADELDRDSAEVKVMSAEDAMS